MTEPPKLMLPADVAKRASSTVSRHLKEWVFGGAVAPLTVRLGSPSEAAVAAHRDAVETWVRAWEQSPLEATWEERRWPSLGRQLVPVAVTITGADAICEAAGQARQWRTLRQRRERLCALDDGPAWPAVLEATFRHWKTLSDNDFDHLLAVLDWLRQNPDSGLLIRQLPIPGVDTKWLGAHRAAVTALAVALGVPEHLGLREREVLRAVAILDPALRRGFPRLFAAPDLELTHLDLAPDRVLVVENLQTLEALPELPATVAVFGSGDNSTAVAEFCWVRSAPRVVYWGDLDAAGFAILTRFRTVRGCESVLMDAAAVHAWEHLAVPDPASEPVDTALLTEAEAAALDLLRRNGLRIEQERIPMSAAAERLRY
ncbi:DUF3322 domain-containing protein [Mycolicibacterium brumae]|uniref:DUF3322 and DUF2220 domain-containing protein n=1 Tax=Mycolicibacterium brumae TaxID=85968 RepID=A0A2G5PCZ2_9MYCO|nr:DUF3322 domain-containing protein [Mycolicibacterium brumae]MCV7193128.1 DUF2399 domain-containing protein [Mycolicibacterium brumae]PIB75950.1 hypothetical protein CQY22_007860 [Mycolicibacterium brumae]RWA16566.1 hypothetical protein MBRU_07520 [Mycolicibacterium brumae DSM 44177]UWW09783.1 DUF3322 domain-containing protein [Mycolicibacterium brumae]